MRNWGKIWLIVNEVDNRYSITIILVIMATTQPFKLIYATQVKDQLKFIERKYHSLIRETIENQVRFEPDVETRNRKPVEPPTTVEADWELCFGSNSRFRAFYTTNIDQREVYIVAIGVKQGNKLFIGGEEVEL